jgi:hypothetical protein
MITLPPDFANVRRKRRGLRPVQDGSPQLDHAKAKQPATSATKKPATSENDTTLPALRTSERHLRREIARPSNMKQGAPSGATVAYANLATSGASGRTHRLRATEPLVIGPEGVREADLASWLERMIEPRVGDLAVEPANGPHFGGQVFTVRSGDAVLGIIKIFGQSHEANEEARSLELATSVRSLQPAALLGDADVVTPAGPTRALFLEYVPEESIAQAIRELPPSGPARHAALAKVERMLRCAALALADLHDTFDTGAAVSPEARERWCASVRERIDKAASLWPAHAADLSSLRQALQEVLFPLVQASSVRSTVIHGDATLRNLVVGANGKLRLYDAKGLARSHDAQDSWYSGGLDLGRLLQHMRTLSNGQRQTALNPDEYAFLGRAVTEAYASRGGGVDANSPTILLARVEYQLASMNLSRNGHEAELSSERLRELTESIRSGGGLARETERLGSRRPGSKRR